MEKSELLEWYKWYRHYVNGYHMEKSDWQELVRLNHLVMEAVHKVHNDNMMDKSNPNTFASSR
jgi:hypothetical protein